MGTLSTPGALLSLDVLVASWFFHKWLSWLENRCLFAFIHFTIKEIIKILPPLFCNYILCNEDFHCCPLSASCIVHVLVWDADTQ